MELQGTVGVSQFKLLIVEKSQGQREEVDLVKGTTTHEWPNNPSRSKLGTWRELQGEETLGIKGGAPELAESTLRFSFPPGAKVSALSFPPSVQGAPPHHSS